LFFLQSDVKLIGAKLMDYFSQMGQLTAGTDSDVDWPELGLHLLEDLQEATNMTCLALQVSNMTCLALQVSNMTCWPSR
jgi:hypothetical protein